ncbi:MAG: RNA 2',3'-cyclic phosphodiesterase [Opitutae bacterium]|nr:RNA 2',3'-cyclic phosphodiesterase [Opitutae bacterium]
MKTRRLFAGVAVEATEAVRGVAAALRRELREERIRWVRPENLHLTLEFFGETEEGRLPELEAALAKAAAGTRVFTMKIGGPGAFGGARHPCVVWLGIDSEGLRELRGRAAAALREAGWEPEPRGFAPHLTLGRMEGVRDLRRFREAMECNREPPAQEQAVKELVLFESVSGQYVALSKWPLLGP